ncbi:MAG TPA: D-amino-acid transaminase [Alphaproteobacteria bacterium]|nr:D-amino-acid transaminase [Alphaproteobacteria bacterium]
MPRTIYVNGQYTPHHDAVISVEDRGFLFGDAVYEVIACIHGHLADETGHLDRLERSLRELQIDMPVERETLRFLMREVLRRNRQKNAAIYLEISRGAAKRDFKFPSPDTMPTLVIITYDFDYDGNAAVKNGIKVKTVADIRWKRRDIKTVLLLPQSLAKQEAVDSGYDDAFMVDPEGYITEASASNAWIVTKDKKLVTRAVTTDILRGITRTAIQKLCKEMNLVLEERSFTPQEAYEAQEAFTSSATALITPVIDIDGHKIGSGKRGDVCQSLYEEYRAYVDGLRGKQVHWEPGL